MADERRKQRRSLFILQLALVAHLGHVLVLELIIKATAGEGSLIDLPEHDVERADDCRD